MQTLINEVIKWGYDKGIINQATEVGQADKTLEEAQELKDAIVNGGEYWGIVDGIGDTMVTLILQAEMQDLKIEQCLEYALEQIQGRKGQIINGQFVKEE